MFTGQFEALTANPHPLELEVQRAGNSKRYPMSLLTETKRGVIPAASY